MTDNWDFYFLQVDDKPASIFVDLGILALAPIATLPVMGYVRLYMQAPREDGLSSRDEFDVLAQIEAHLEAKLVGDDTCYVGRCTTNGCRDFFFYMAQQADWPQRVATSLQAYADYRFEAKAREEPDWAAYLEYLYPTEIDRQTIENRRVCEALVRAGDQLDVAREIDHWAYFLDATSRDAFVADAAQLGYACRVLIDAQDDDARFGAQLWRVDAPTLTQIDDITLPLFHLANTHDGEYDGWESIVSQ